MCKGNSRNKLRQRENGEEAINEGDDEESVFCHHEETITDEDENSAFGQYEDTDPQHDDATTTDHRDRGASFGSEAHHDAVYELDKNDKQHDEGTSPEAILNIDESRHNVVFDLNARVRRSEMPSIYRKNISFQRSENEPTVGSRSGSSLSLDSLCSGSSDLSLGSGASLWLNVSDLLQKEGERVGMLFDMIDTDRNGFVSQKDLFHFFKKSLRKRKIKMPDELLQEAVNTLIATVNTDKAQVVSRDEFICLFQENEDLYRVFETKETEQDRMIRASSRLDPKELEQERFDMDELWHHVRTNVKDNEKYVVWAVIYFAALCFILIRAAFAMEHNQESQDVFGHCVTVARASAAAINFNCALVLLPVSRHLVSWARHYTWMRNILYPLDGLLKYHMFVGAAIGIFSAIHVLGHACTYARFVYADQDDLEALLSHEDDLPPEDKSGRLQWAMKHVATITGILMVICLVVAYSVIRTRREKFNRFWIFHHLLILMVVLMCIHGTGNMLKNFQSIYWVGGPLCLYLLPRLYRELTCVRRKVLYARLHGDILSLRVTKPRAWNVLQKPGMYAFVNIPSLSRIEWHPFTISSAPSQDHVEFHIKNAGDWTNRLHELVVSTGGEDGAASLKEMPICIEGPFGASSQEYRDYPVVVLIGAGIGVTPMVSVVRSLLSNPGKVKKAFFYWTLREASDVFKDLMEEIYLQDENNLIEIRHFITSLKRDDRDLGDVLFRYAANAFHNESGRDIFLGYRTKNHGVGIGRPKWHKELRHAVAAANKMGKKDCGVFLCGPEKMAAEVKKACYQLSKEDNQCHVHFSKETF